MDPFTLALGGISAIPSLYAAFKQNKAANDLKLQDTATNGERENLAMSRQGAATGRLPGMGAAQDRLGMVQAGALQNAQLGATSSSDFLASAGGAAAQQAQGEQALSTQGLQYQDQQKQQLRADLNTQSQRQQHDLDVYNQQKAALTQGSAQNLNNAVQTGVGYAAQAYNMGAGLSATQANAANGAYDPLTPNTPSLTMPSQGNTLPSNLPGSNIPGMGYGRYMRSYNMGAGNVYNSSNGY